MRLARRRAHSVETISLNTSSDPFASDNHRPGSASASAEAETKIQRKNAKKNEAKKAQKEAEEADRLARLAAHKKGLERYVATTNDEKMHLCTLAPGRYTG